MTKDVLVSVRGTQTMGEENDTIEIITSGSLAEKDGRAYLLYDEAAEGVDSVTHNTVRIQPDRVEVTKRGNVECRMIFECGKKHMVNYRTPLGLIILGVTTSTLNVEKSENAVCVHIEYALEMNGEFVSCCRMDICAGPREECVLNLNET